MKPTSRQSEASATNSRTDFHRAVLRLTAYYSVGVFIMLAIFSMLVYGLFVEGINEDEREDAESSIMEERFHEESKERLFDILVISDLILLVCAVGVSYVLSRKTLAPLEDAYQKQKRFVADAAHELRTPLAVMKAGLEVSARQERTIAEYQSLNSETLEEVERMIALSNDLLILARNGSASRVMEKISLGDVCKKQVRSLEAYAKTNEVAITDSIEEGVFIKGRPEALSRLVLNLLKNAIDYNKRGGTIELTLKRANQHAELVIRDTGIGIADKDIPHIFDRFYKADTARTHSSVSGSGLGLAIVKDIVEEHGGTVSVESVLGEGVTLHLAFILA